MIVTLFFSPYSSSFFSVSFFIESHVRIVLLFLSHFLSEFGVPEDASARKAAAESSLHDDTKIQEPTPRHGRRTAKRVEALPAVASLTTLG